MLLGALCRLTASGGDAVVQLQTNYGGGKPHSMLALYPLAGRYPGPVAREKQGLLNSVRKPLPLPPAAGRAMGRSGNHVRLGAAEAGLDLGELAGDEDQGLERRLRVLVVPGGVGLVGLDVDA